MFPKSFIISALFILFIPSIVAASRTHAAEDLEHLLSQTHSMQANFIQTVTNGKGEVINTTSGEMYVARPNQFRWETTNPNKQIIVANEKELWIYDEDLEQATVRKHTAKHEKKENSDDFLNLLFSPEKNALAKHFAIEFVGNRNQDAFALVPLNSDAILRKVILKFDHGQLSEMRMMSNLDQETTVKFSSIRTNNRLRASLFQFKPPKGVDVIPQ